jgi:U4/U6.U5 tri-snRNP component SNU23
MSNFAGGAKNKRDEETPSSSSHVTLDSMGRRVWDKQVFEQKFEESQPAAKFQKLVTGPTDTLKPHSNPFDIIDAKINERRIVTNSSAKPNQGGFYCEVCDCLLRDSVAYTDHLNGKTHNRMLGMSMHVERVSLERVKAKLREARGRFPIVEKLVEGIPEI